MTRQTISKNEKDRIERIRARHPHVGQRTLARFIDAGDDHDRLGRFTSTDYADSYGVYVTFASIYGVIRRYDKAQADAKRKGRLSEALPV